MMRNLHEIELKRRLVGQNAGEKFLRGLGAPIIAELHQTNYIFDTDDRAFDRAHYAVRLRKENNVAFLTAKGPSDNASQNAVARLEAETKLEPPAVDELLRGDRDPISALQDRLREPEFDRLWREIRKAQAGRPLKLWGSFSNLRRVVTISLPDGPKLDLLLDTTRFPNGAVDEEIEIEMPNRSLADEVEHWLDRTTTRLGVETAPSSPKIARFFAAVTNASP